MFRTFSLIITFLVILQTPAIDGSKIDTILKHVKTLAKPVKFTIYNLLNALSVDGEIYLNGIGCGVIKTGSSINGPRGRATLTLPSGCLPTKVVIEILSNGKTCQVEVASTQRRVFVVSNPLEQGGCIVQRNHP